MNNLNYVISPIMQSVLYWRCLDKGNKGANVDNGKSVYTFFLKKKVAVSIDENQTDVAIEWVKTVGG